MMSLDRSQIFMQGDLDNSKAISLKNKKFAVIGGDLRYIKIISLLKQYGFDVAAAAFDNQMTDIGVEVCSISNAVNYADCIILPMPVLSGKGNSINAPFAQESLSIYEVLDNLDSSKMVFGGKIPQWLCDKLTEMNVQYCDYLECEDMAQANAVPTAEGAIQIAMEELPITIDGSCCLTLGYGRIGKALCSRLKALGAENIVAVRSQRAIDEINSDGHRGIFINEISHVIADMDVIFNTIPALIIDEALLKLINEEALLIDLASKPGGVDFESAQQFDFKTIWALSLPGKVAPYTAGQIILSTIFNQMSEL